jgi:hypothetical protein
MSKLHCRPASVFKDWLGASPYHFSGVQDMRRLICAATILATGFISLPAFAQDSDQETVQIGGQVAPLCILGTPSQAMVDLGQLIDTSGPRVGKLTTISNRTITMPGSFCNYANSAITVDATALVAADMSTPQAGFARAVNFNAAASGWATPDASATTAASAAGASPTASNTGGTQPTPRLNDVTLTLSAFSVPSDLLLVAGGYTGQVVITLGPAAGNPQ